MTWPVNKGLEGLGEGLGGTEKTKEAFAEASMIAVPVALPDTAGSSTEKFAVPFYCEIAGLSVNALTVGTTSSDFKVTNGTVDIHTTVLLKANEGVPEATMLDNYSKNRRICEPGTVITVTNTATGGGASNDATAIVWLRRLPAKQR